MTEPTIINPKKPHLWWNQPWTLVEGCTRCSEGRKDCWALESEKRYGRAVEGGGIRCRYDRRFLPNHWQKPRVAAIWNDVFHEGVAQAFLDDIFGVMGCCEAPDNSKHTFLCLTKRPRRMRRYGQGRSEAGMGWPPNAWAGVTCESTDYLWRVEELVKTPAAVRFVNWHGLGPLDLLSIVGGPEDRALPDASDQPCIKCGELWEDDDHECAQGFGPGVDAVFVECNRPFRGDPAEWWAWCHDLVDDASDARCAVWVKQGPTPSGRVSHDFADFPEWARRREFPQQPRAGTAERT